MFVVGKSEQSGGAAPKFVGKPETVAEAWTHTLL